MEINQNNQFDPKKNYEWSPESVFQFTGQEFAFMYNFLLVEKAKAMAQLEMINIMEEKLKKAIADGIAKEHIPSQIFQPNQEIIKP